MNANFLSSCFIDRYKPPLMHLDIVSSPLSKFPKTHFSLNIKLIGTPQRFSIILLLVPLPQPQLKRILQAIF